MRTLSLGSQACMVVSVCVQVGEWFRRVRDGAQAKYMVLRVSW